MLYGRLKQDVVIRGVGSEQCQPLPRVQPFLDQHWLVLEPKWSGCSSSSLPDTFLSGEAAATGKTGQMDPLIVLTAIQPIDR